MALLSALRESMTRHSGTSLVILGTLLLSAAYLLVFVVTGAVSTMPSSEVDAQAKAIAFPALLRFFDRTLRSGHQD